MKTKDGKILASEHEIQASFFDWIETQRAKHPVLNYFFAIPNGANKSMSARMKFKREGLRPGVPDVCCPIPSANGKYFGLFIEFKSAGGKVSMDQEVWINNLRTVGHQVLVLRDWRDAANYAIEYHGLKIRKFEV